MVSYLTTTYSGPWANWKLFNAPSGVPVHNNGLEGLNGGFKKNGTMRERADLGTFARSVFDWIYVESTNALPLPTTPLVPPSTWRKAQLLEVGQNSRLDHSVKADFVSQVGALDICDLEGVWLMPSFKTVSSLKAPTAEAKRLQILGHGAKFLKTLHDPSIADSFNQLANCWKGFYVLRPKYISDEIHYECSCPLFAKTLQCAHALALGIRQGNVVVPQERSLATLGRTRRPKGGRYAKAKPAWVRQDDEEDQAAGTAFASSQAPDPCCYICGGRKSTKGNKIVFCDGVCDCGYHQKCLRPP